MYNIIIVGKTGTGKTTLAKKIIEGKNHLVFDVNNEYEGFNRWIDVSDTEGFLNHILENERNKIIVIDEASIFFNNRKYSDLLNHLLVKKRHHNNIYVLNFHSLRKVPLYIIDFLDYVFIKKTNDTEKILEKYQFNDKFKECFLNVKSSKDPYYYEVVNIKD